ncbi:hypothetical protein FRC11_000557 [Ceratobasidium sp. 423]|nr:hypothetical protein FRC11_000557 [Ceratobasidium sp. 423]
MDRVPKTMRELLLEGCRKPYVCRTDLPVPSPGPGEVLLRVKAAGFCHSEMVHYEMGDVSGRKYFTYSNLAQNSFPGGKAPVIPGHENVGVVVTIGEGVTEFKIGDRVGTTLFRQTCGASLSLNAKMIEYISIGYQVTDVCKSGTTNLCDTRENAGINSDGGFTEYMRVHMNWTVPLPDEMPFATAAPLMCADPTIYNSIIRAGKPKGSVTAIMGAGGLGYLSVQFAKAMGYKVAAVETRQPPTELLHTLPPHLIINPRDDVEKALASVSSSFSGAPGSNPVQLQRCHIQGHGDCSRNAEPETQTKGDGGFGYLVKDYHDPGLKGRLVLMVE